MNKKPQTQSKNVLLGLCTLCAGLFGVLAFRLLRTDRTAMGWWVEHISMPYKRGFSALVDPLTISFCELAATAAGLAVLLWLIRCLVRKGRGLLTWAAWTASAVVWIYLLVCAFWGTQYYAPTFTEQAGMHGGAVSVEELEAATRLFARMANETADGVERDENGVFCNSVREVFDRSRGCMDGLAEEYPFLAGPVRRPKIAVYSKVMSAAGFTGYICPLFGESTLNIDPPRMFLPVTVAHEFSHQRGVAAELEANFCGIEACITCGDAMYAYSGWLFGYLHLGNALYSADYDRWAAVSSTLNEQVRADLTANNEYWAKWEGPAQEVGETVYNNFLYSYDQTMGMKSYGACVNLLVEKYGSGSF